MRRGREETSVFIDFEFRIEFVRALIKLSVERTLRGVNTRTDCTVAPHGRSAVTFGADWREVVTLVKGSKRQKNMPSPTPERERQATSPSLARAPEDEGVAPTPGGRATLKTSL